MTVLSTLNDPQYDCLSYGWGDEHWIDSESYDRDYDAFLMYPSSELQTPLSSVQPQTQLSPYQCGYLDGCSASYLPLEPRLLEYHDFALSPHVPSGEQKIDHRETCNAEFSGRYSVENKTRHNRQAPGNSDLYGGMDDHNKRGRTYEHIHPEALHPPWASARNMHVHVCRKTDAQHKTEKGANGHHDDAEWSVIHISNASPSHMMRMLLLRLYLNHIESKSGDEDPTSNRPYGLIYMHKPRWSYTLMSVLYMVLELVLCLALRNCELCQGVATPECESFATSEFCLDTIWTFLDAMLPYVSAMHSHCSPRLHSQEKIERGAMFLRLSTFLFVCFALMYGAAVINHYRLRRRDAYQYLAVPVGIMAGLCILASSTGSSNESPKMVSTFAFCISVANVLSVCAHSIWRTLISPRRVRLQRKIEEWMHQSNLEVDQPRKGVRFHEIY
jgi:hypothetical protein